MMTEPDALEKRRHYLLDSIARAADEIAKIDDRLSSLLKGRGKGGAAA